MTAAVRRVPTSAPISPALRDACAPFGVLAIRDPRAPRADDGTACTIMNRLGVGEVVLVTGASGSGKSTILRALARALLERGEPVVEIVPAPPDDRSVVDTLSGPTARRLGVLARAGLADATLLPRRASELSAGEAARLALARAIGQAEALTPAPWVIADEFASALDRATAQALAHTVVRWVRSSGARLVAATAHEDIATFLGPEMLARVAPGGAASLDRGPRAERVRVRCEPGTIEDYRALARHHYRGGTPATRVSVRRAVRTLPDGTRRVAGVLIASMPVLNGSWRDLAWPGRYTTGDKRARARRINRELRCITRVVVEPASRGLGIARRLTEDYLSDPPTPATEALAQMGAYAPFFERAGMRAYPRSAGADDARLADALDAAGVGDGLLPERAAEFAADPFVAREVARWARARKLVRGLGEFSPGERLMAAASLARTPPVAYAHAA